MKTILTLLSCLVLLLPARAEEKSSKELLRDGLFEEEVNQDFSKAEAAYRNVTKRYDEERYFAGLAFFRLAEIARKSGNPEQAQALYRRVALEFSDQKEIAKRATEHLGEDAPEINRIASAVPLPSNVEEAELQRLKKMERDSPDLLNGMGKDGWHPLHQAAANGWTNAVDYLLERKVTVDPRAPVKAEYRSDGYTPLHLAVIHGHLSVVDRLLAAKADPNLAVNISPADLPLPVQSKSIQLDSRGDWSPLHLAILFQRREIMTRLLEAKATLANGGPALDSYKTTTTRTGGQLRTTNWKLEGTPLMLAIWLDDRIAIQSLLDHGADVNQAASEEGETPLLAAIWNNPNLVPTLLENGAKVSDNHVFGRTILHWSIAKCEPPVILRLIKEGADVNSRVEISQNSYEGHPSPLEIAMRWDFNGDQREELCAALLEAGAQPTPRVLTSAAAYSQLNTMRALIAAKVDPNGSSDQGNRSLHYVKNAQAAQILIEAGARLEVKNHDGITPLGIIITQEDTPQSRTLIDYLLEQGADASMMPALLYAKDSNMRESPLLPYVMSKTILGAKSNPKAITFAFPRNWQTVIGEDLVLPGTPAPSLKELLSLNYQILSEDRNIGSSSSTSRSSTRSKTPPVVTDLIIYRSNENGELIEIAQLADQAVNQKQAPTLQWGDIVLFRAGLEQNDKQFMPLVHYVSGLEPRTVTFKVGSWEHKVSIDNTHRTAPGLELQNHFSTNAEIIDLSKITLRRASGESATINLAQSHDPKKVRLLDGDVIEYSLKTQPTDPFSPKPSDLTMPPSGYYNTYIFYPDRPLYTGAHSWKQEMALSELLHNASLLEGRDFSKLEIQRPGKEQPVRTPLDLVAASHSLANGKEAVTKAIEMLKTIINPGDILVFPPKENVSWQQVNSFTSAAQTPETRSLINLVKPAPRPRNPVPAKSTSPRVRRIPNSPTR